MKVLIANPAVRRQTECGHERYLLGSGIRFPWSMLKHRGQRPRFSLFPMFLGYTAALLRDGGHDVRALDGVALDIETKVFLDHVSGWAPEVIVLEPNSAVIDDILEIARSIKSRLRCQVVLVGTHVTARCFDIMQHRDAVDFVITGEFEYGVFDLVNAMAGGTETALTSDHQTPAPRYQDISLDDRLAGVAGLARHDKNGRLVMPSAVARQVGDLDALPYPARDLFPAWFDTDHSAYHDGFNQRQPAFDMHATRGCPYRCNFCVWVQVLYQNGPHRTREIGGVIEEMLYLVQHHGAREIYFDDDNFMANRKFVDALCTALIARGSDIPWSAMGDAIALNESMLEKMADAGCIGIKFGLDSADAGVLSDANKPLEVSRITGLVARARSLGIKTHMTVVMGLKGETRESLNRTFRFACKLDIDSIQLSVATPLPGTRLFEELAAENKLHLARWDELDGYSSVVIEYEDFPHEYLEDFVAPAHTRWIWSRLRSPRWIVRQLRYQARLGAGQGATGLRRRLIRLLRLLSGDSSVVGCAGNTGPKKSVSLVAISP